MVQIAHYMHEDFNGTSREELRRVTRVQTPFWTEDRSSVLCQRLHPTKYHAQDGTTAKETPS